MSCFFDGFDELLIQSWCSQHGLRLGVRRIWLFKWWLGLVGDITLHIWQGADLAWMLVSSCARALCATSL